MYIYSQCHKNNLWTFNKKKRKKKGVIWSFKIKKFNFGALLHRSINMYFSVEFTRSVQIILEKLVPREF